METIWKTARECFYQAKGSHGWDHTVRVLRLCERIGYEENADMDILRIAALLHDIGRDQQDRSQGTICHAEAGMKLAKPIISRTGLPEDKIDNILHCIKTHRFRAESLPETIEAKVLFDADKLDAIGAVGVARAFLFAGEIGAGLHNDDTAIEDTRSYTREDTGYREYCVKLCRIKDRLMTSAGRRLAEDRHKFMELFFKQFLEEYQGIR